VTQETAVRAAASLAEVRRTGVRIDGLPDGLKPTSLAEAYAIQDAYVPMILELSGGTRAGYKAGATAEAPQQMFGLEAPFRGVLLTPFIHQSPAEIPADACFMRVLEAEFAFRMADDLPPAAAPYDLDAVAGAVGALLTSIEVVDLRYSTGMQAGGLQVIADNGGGGHWVQGNEVADWSAIDLDDYPVSLSINGTVVQQGNSANVLGNPLNSLAWLANDLCMAGGGLRAGDIVTTGTCTAPTPAEPGDEAVADFGDLGQVTVRFGA